MTRKRFQVHGKVVKISPNMVFSGTDFSGADLHGADFSKCRLISVNLSGCDLTNANFRDAEVYSKAARTNFSGARLVGAHFKKTVIRDADFSGADFSDAIFRSTNFLRVTLDNAILKRTRGALTMTNVRARSADFAGTKYASIMIADSNLAGSSLCGASWKSVEIYESDLSTVTATGATLLHAHLDRCNLDGATFTGLVAPRLDVRSGSLRGADLTGADLSAAKLAHVHLDGCVLDGANLCDAEVIIPASLPKSLQGVDLGNVMWPNFDDVAADLPSQVHQDWSLGAGKRLRRSLGYLTALCPDLVPEITLIYGEHPGASSEVVVTLAKAVKGYDPPATAGNSAISLYPLVGAFSAPR
jgi:uncharacterized protein YjbI with pentapeptide repeats